LYGNALSLTSFSEAAMRITGLPTRRHLVVRDGIFGGQCSWDKNRYFFQTGGAMKGFFEIIAAGIGLAFITTAALLVYAFAAKWKWVYKIYFGLASLLLLHIFLFYFAAFGEDFPLPAVFAKYTFGILDLLAGLIPV
jgi:hypothetical protein